MKLIHRCSALLGAAYLAGAAAAQADPAPLNVPILMRGALGEDACPQRSRVIGTETDTVSVQGGPNTGFREVGQVHGGDVVLVCERLGPWLGVVYGSEPLGLSDHGPDPGAGRVRRPLREWLGSG